MLLLEGAIAKEAFTPTAQLPDMPMASYMTSCPLPRPSISQVEQSDPGLNDEERNANPDLLSLDQANGASSLPLLVGLPRNLFSNRNVSAFCESTTQDDDKLSNGNFQASSDDAFISELVSRRNNYRTTGARGELHKDNGATEK